MLLVVSSEEVGLTNCGGGQVNPGPFQLQARSSPSRSSVSSRANSPVIPSNDVPTLQIRAQTSTVREQVPVAGKTRRHDGDPMMSIESPTNSGMSHTESVENSEDPYLRHESEFYPNGDSYMGHFLNGMKHGRGVYLFANGSQYKGNWAYGKMHGWGVFFENNTGDRFEGDWVEGERSMGIYYYANHDLYSGGFLHNKKNGRGVVWERRRMYEVQYNQDICVEKCLWTMSNKRDEEFRQKEAHKLQELVDAQCRMESELDAEKFTNSELRQQLHGLTVQVGRLQEQLAHCQGELLARPATRTLLHSPSKSAKSVVAHDVWHAHSDATEFYDYQHHAIHTSTPSPHRTPPPPATQQNAFEQPPTPSRSVPRPTAVSPSIIPRKVMKTSKVSLPIQRKSNRVVPSVPVSHGQPGYLVPTAASIHHAEHTASQLQTIRFHHEQQQPLATLSTNTTVSAPQPRVSNPTPHSTSRRASSPNVGRQAQIRRPPSCSQSARSFGATTQENEQSSPNPRALPQFIESPAHQNSTVDSVDNPGASSGLFRSLPSDRPPRKSPCTTEDIVGLTTSSQSMNEQFRYYR